MSSRKLFSIFSNSYTITFSSFDHTIPVPEIFNSNEIESKLRLEVLSYSLPHFIWRATATHEGDKVLDFLFDATDIEQGQFFLRAIEYNQELSEVLREIAKSPSLEQTFQTTSEGKIIEWFKQQSND
jgi:hypothetical protein